MISSHAGLHGGENKNLAIRADLKDCAGAVADNCLSDAQVRTEALGAPVTIKTLRVQAGPDGAVRERGTT